MNQLSKEMLARLQMIEAKKKEKLERMEHTQKQLDYLKRLAINNEKKNIYIYIIIVVPYIAYGFIKILFPPSKSLAGLAETSKMFITICKI